jgi:hypothetical protein
MGNISVTYTGDKQTMRWSLHIFSGLPFMVDDSHGECDYYSEDEET